MSVAAVSSVAAPEIPLKDRELAAFLGWLVPGLGHLYQGRLGKAILYFVCIMGLFVYGLYLGSDRESHWYGRVVYFAGRERLPYVCQVCVGLPALPALVQAYRATHGDNVWFWGVMAPPRPMTASVPAEEIGAAQPTLHDLQLRLNRFFELGTVYTMIAGLLNVLAIYDAWGGPVFMTGPEPKKKEDDNREDAEKKA